MGNHWLSFGDIESWKANLGQKATYFLIWSWLWFQTNNFIRKKTKTTWLTLQKIECSKLNLNREQMRWKLHLNWEKNRENNNNWRRSICRTTPSFSWLMVTPKTPRAEPPTTPAGHHEAWRGRPSRTAGLDAALFRQVQRMETQWNWLVLYVKYDAFLYKYKYICITNAYRYRCTVYKYIRMHASFCLCFLKVLLNLSTGFKEHPHGFHWTMLVSSNSLKCTAHFLHRKQETTMITTQRYMCIYIIIYIDLRI